jgi:chromosome segregation ATPase
VSADPATHPDALADVRDALKAVRALRGGDAEFFSGVFSRLESATGAVKASQQARDRQLHELRQQQQLWEQERTVLEHELEAVRNRVAELSETVARQKRDAESQQQQWSGELKRMRRSLQEVVLRLAERAQETADPAVRNVTRSPDTSKVGAIADPVLDSVMAQFEILQNDVARRRKPPAS